MRGNEILPTLKTIILSDEIFKKIYEKSLDSEIDYGKSLHFKENTIPIGRLANIYRHLEEKYSSLSEALLSTESFEFLKKKIFKHFYLSLFNLSRGNFSLSIPS